MRFLILIMLVGFAMAAVRQTRIHRKTDSLRERLARNGLKAWQEYRQKKQLHRERIDRSILAGHPQSVNDYSDKLYVANVTIGTGEIRQVFQVILDTGSSDIWVPDSSYVKYDCSSPQCSIAAYCDIICDVSCCCTHSCADQVGGQHKFNSSWSPTYVPNGRRWGDNFGSDAGGFLGVDTLIWGDENTDSPLIVPSTTFGQATRIDSSLLNEAIDGVLGLAFPSMSEQSITPPFIEAINQGLVDQPLFTVWLEHEGNGKNVFGGIYTWGGVDTDHCGELAASASLTTATYFQFRLQSLSVGSYSSKVGWEAISDTDASFLELPKDVADKIATSLGGKFDAELELYRISCGAQTIDLNLNIGGATLPLRTANLIVPLNDERCVLGIEAFDSFGFGPEIILGDPFNRQYCNVYNIGGKSMQFYPSLQM